MKKKKLLLLFVLIPLWLVGFPNLIQASASEGGQAEKSVSVQTKGVITFETEESTAPTSESTSESTVETSTESSERPPAGGKLPNTGEKVTSGLTIGGILLLLIGLLFFWRNRQKNKDEGAELK